MRISLATAILAATLAGCASDQEPVVNTIQVNTPVAMSCVPDNLPVGALMVDPTTGEIQPDYPDTLEALLAAPEVADFEKLLYQGRQLRQKRLETLEDVVAKCRAIKPLTVAK